MFTSIHIKSFRSCIDVKLQDLESILVLIGRNGAGKTNLMKAIAWACQFGSYASSAATTARFRRSDGDVQLTFTIDGESYCYAVRRETNYSDELKRSFMINEHIYVTRDGKSEPILRRTGEDVTILENGQDTTAIQIAAGAPCLPAIHSLLPESHHFKSIAEKILKFLASVKYYPLHNFEEIEDGGLVTGEVYKKWKANKLEEFNNILSLQCTLIEISEEYPDILEELNSLLGQNGLGIIDRVSVEGHAIPKHTAEDKTYAFFWVSFFMPGSSSDSGFPISDLSFGTIRILFLLVSMLYDKASVALLEQPEDGIHMALIKKLVPMLREYSFRSQFILSSHSSAVMNLTEASEIRFITNDGYTSARALSGLELEVAKEFLEDEGSLSEFLESIGE